MIAIGSEYASIERHLLENNGEILRSKSSGENFRAYETELKRRSQRDIIPGTTSSMNECSVAIKTGEPIAKTILSDDTVIWQNEAYSVITVQETHSAVRLNGREYIIYLKR